VPSNAISKSSCRVRDASATIREANSACSRRLSGSVRGSGCSGELPPRLTAAGSSSRARGLPCASERIRWRIAGPRVGKCAATSRLAASSSSGRSSSSASPTVSKKLSSPDRDAPSTPTRLPARRRATNPNTSALARSSHGRSSITTRIGRAAATWRNSARVAFDTTSRSGARPSLNPSATLSASRWVAVRCPNSASSGSRIWLSPEKMMTASNSTPLARSTHAPADEAVSAAACRSTVFPTPGSPNTSSASPSLRVRSTNARIVANSPRRPMRASPPEPSRCGESS
jgi:hypothetical protein